MVGTGYRIFHFGEPAIITTSSSSTTTGYTSTTSTIIDDDCPLDIIYGVHAEKTKLIRQFRDTVLSKTPEGQELIKLYYQWSPVIVKGMEQDEEFKQEIKGIVDSILPMIEREMELHSNPTLATTNFK